MLELDASIVVAIIALAGSILTALISRGKMDKSEAVNLEARLKDMEATEKLMALDITFIKENMMSREEKECLILLNERVSVILKGLGTLVPKDLRNPANLDLVLEILSDKAAVGGWPAVISYVKHDLDPDKRTDLLAYLEQASQDKRRREKRYWASLYLGLLRLELDREDKEPVCAPAA